MADYLHNDPAFGDLMRIVAEKHKINLTLVEKDYWIMHSLYGLKKQGIDFELKGGTSLSKGFGLIHRFSEDIDIHIATNFGLEIEGKDDRVKEDRKKFYDKLAGEIKINGIIGIERDHAFDDIAKYRSGGIRLYYTSHTETLQGVKEGILLEAGFDTVAPNMPLDISSWVLDYVKKQQANFQYIDNRAKDVLCYLPEYTLVEKLQTIVNKYRKEADDAKPRNFMRQYYDVYCLLNNEAVQKFIGTDEYIRHKKTRFRGADRAIPLNDHPALLIPDNEIRKSFEKRYLNSAALYYKSQPSFSDILEVIRGWAAKL